MIGRKGKEKLKLLLFSGESIFDIFGRSLVKAVKEESPSTIHKCPYSGLEGVTGININKLMRPVLPNIMPTGTYKLLLRFHCKDNTTIFTVEVVANVQAEDVMKRIPMG